jgi:hypothetical protein
MTVFIDPPADDAEAKEVLASAYEDMFGEVNLFALGIAQAIGLQEGDYGRWGPANKSNNWGAITRKPNADGSCPADSFSHKDSSFETGEYTTCFRVWPSSLDGAKGFLHELYENRPAVFDAAQTGDIRGVAEEMYASGYYMGTNPHNQKDDNGAFSNVNDYIDFIGRGVDQIADLYPHGGGENTSSNTGLFIALGVGAVGLAAIAMR